MASKLKKMFKGKSGSSKAPANAPANVPNASNSQDTAVTAGRSALYQLWKGITGEAKVPMGGVKYWDLERDPWRERPVAFTTAEFYGCTVVLIADAKHALIGHFHEERGAGTVKVMHDEDKVQEYITAQLDSLTSWDWNEESLAWIIHSSGRSVGYELVKASLQESGIREDRIHNRPYTRGSGVGEFPDSPRGKAVLQWKQSDTGETLSVYIQKEDPEVYSYNNNGKLL